jgi:glycosyltransferase involved in cell wall biosynthesis
MYLSVIISTHNPHPERLWRTIESINSQTLSIAEWELILVDNASTDFSTIEQLGLPLPKNSNTVREDRLGLSFGRLAGIRRSCGDILVFVDDDNVISEQYLEITQNVFERIPGLGLGGGRSLPEWERGDPDPWVSESFANLALRDFGEAELLGSSTMPPTYPAWAPIGAGMVARKDALASWITECVQDGAPTGRRGRKLSSGEDCDIVMYALADGWQVGYFPDLILTHLIPSSRLTRTYLGRLNYEIAKSWVQVLARHGVRPWPPAARWSVPYRKARAYCRYRAWAGPAQYIRWMGACGQFEGRATLR